MVLILGFTGIFGKLISLNTIELVWYRMLIAFITLFTFLVFKKELTKIKKKDFFGLLFVGSLVAVHWFFFFESIKVSNVSVAVVCLSTASFFSAMIEPLFLKRKPKLYEYVLGIVVFVTLFLMLEAETKYTMGYVYGIIASFLGTLFTLYNAKYVNKLEASKITMVEMLAGVIIFSILMLLNEEIGINNLKININDFVYLFLLGTICTAAVFVWMVELMKYISPYSLIMAINLEPIYSIVLALIIFSESEHMNLSFYIGASIIILVVFLESYLKNKIKS
ncbi:DMT family transporter [Bacteroidota bacterium]|nr:DMT family transporter [Bacteroidota bacterium]MDC3230033.1 DMT family transporter [Bacteroidota bacterium]